MNPTRAEKPFRDLGCGGAPLQNEAKRGNRLES